MSGCPKFNFKNLLHTRGFSDIDCKLDIDGSINCCVYLIYMHNIVYYESKYGMPDCLNYESTLTQISYILYFIKISKLPTLKGQCRLESIVIKFLIGINQLYDKITSNSQYPSMLPSQEEWGPIDTTF